MSSFREFLTEGKTILELGKRVDVPKDKQKEEGCVQFQSIQYKIPLGKSFIKGEVDTKILANGKQIVHGGDGYFKDGMEINLKNYEIQK